MTTPDGKSVVFRGASRFDLTFEWPIELFLLAAHECRTFEEFKVRLFMTTTGRLDTPKVAVAAAGVTK